jgi:hypothetical protein
VTSSSLERTSAQEFNVATDAASGTKGVQLWTTPLGAATIAGIDLMSVESSPNNWDVRIQSSGGTAGAESTGNFSINCNRFDLNGNSYNSNAPQLRTRGDIVLRTTDGFVAGKGRAGNVQQVCWTGSGANDPTNPVITIPLLGEDGVTPIFGMYDVSITTGFSGGGDVAVYSSWAITKNAVPPTGIVEGRNVAGNDLTVLYAEADWNVAGYPQLKLFNKQGGTNFIYLIRGLVYPDNDGY